MKKGRIFFFLCFFLILINLKSKAQFYISPSVCVSASNSSTPSSGPSSTSAATTSCDFPTTFFDTDLTSISRKWDFGETSGLNFSTRNASFLYTTLGAKTVSLTKTFASGSTSTVTKTVTVSSYPTQPTFAKKITTDTTVCDGSSLTLNPYKGSSADANSKFLWFPNGETSPTISVTKSGCYSVQVTNGTTGCSRIAKINVKFCLQDPATSGGNEKWFFGKNAIINFAAITKNTFPDSTLDTGSAVPSPDVTVLGYNTIASAEGNPMQTDNGDAMVYGPSGDLAYFSDGENIYSGKDKILLKNIDGTAFHGTGKLSSQGVLLVPRNTCNECPHHQYYLFTVDPITHLLSYSLIDTRYNNLVGAVAEQNVPLAYPISEKLVAMPNAKGDGFVIYAHNSNDDGINVITSDTTGIKITTSNIGQNYATLNTQSGYTAISPDHKYYAQVLSYGGANYVQLFDIDNSTGKLSNPKIYNLQKNAPPNAYGITFSPNSELVYVTIKGDPALSQSSFLLQLNLKTSAINTISQSATEAYGAVAMGPTQGVGSKYVYLSISGRSFAPYLQEPNKTGNATTVAYTDVPGSANTGVPLGGVAKFGLPNIVYATNKQNGEGAGANYTGNCKGVPTVLTSKGVCSPMTNDIAWLFADGTSKQGSTVSYTFPNLGWNYFKLIITVKNKPAVSTGNQVVDKTLETKCTEKVIDAKVFINPSPEYKLPDDFSVCVNDGERRKVTLTPTGGKVFSYNWMTSLGTTISTDPFYEFYAAATYKIEVTNELKCVTKADFKVYDNCSARIIIPDAFSPNNDGTNDKFEVVTKYSANESLKIYNRWGELIYESNPDDFIRSFTDNKRPTWDGNYNGKPCPSEVYPYVFFYQDKMLPNPPRKSIRGSIYLIK